MTLRCKQCHAVVWVAPGEGGASSDTVACRGCGQEYEFQRGTLDERALRARARRLAKEHELDLPGAYSVLLGIATVEELSELGSAGSTVCRTAPVPGPAEPQQQGRHKYDCTFQPAIDEGFLTPRQAVERGKRDACAAILASRHGLSMEVAYEIADNRISLLEAIRRRPHEPDAVPVVVEGSTLRTIGLLAVLAVALGLAAVFGVSGGGVSGNLTTQSVGTSEIRTDSGGAVVEILGPDPWSVLRAYCSSARRASDLVPLDVVPSSIPGLRARLGLLRDPDHPGTLLAITIREDREAGRWRAGEAGRRLVAEPAPAGAQNAVHRP